MVEELRMRPLAQVMRIGRTSSQNCTRDGVYRRCSGAVPVSGMDVSAQLTSFKGLSARVIDAFSGITV